VHIWLPTDSAAQFSDGPIIEQHSNRLLVTSACLFSVPVEQTVTC